MRTKIVLAAAVSVAVLAGCAGPIQQVSPARLEVKQVCVIENPRVRASFLTAMQNALGSRGYSVRLLPETSPTSACPVVAQYTANWKWDLALYMAYADIKVFQDSKQVGSALYNATHVMGASKFINGEEKVNELIGQLFPN